jgi:hypothetical protein
MKGSNYKMFLFIAVSTVLLTVSRAGPLALGQVTATGAMVQGTVQDSTNASIPGATVTITNDATGGSSKVISDAAGRYLFNNLNPVSYTVRVEMQGFKTLVRPNVVLRTGQQTVLDFKLEVGSVSTTVEVKGSAQLLNSASAALGEVIENKFITELPVMDRQLTSLALLVPGVHEMGDTTFCGGGVGATPGMSNGMCTQINFQSNGQRNSSSDVLLDGAILAPPEAGQGSGQNSMYWQPAPEAIEEFKLQNNSFSAEYGSNGGSSMIFVTKSGTNRLHGSGYLFDRRPQLAANDFYSNLAGIPKTTGYERDQFGGTVGGPIIKQKTFFFFDYDRTRFHSAAPWLGTVPTAAQRSGDFSNSFNLDGTPINIYNPNAVTPVYQSGQIVDYQRAPLSYQGVANVIPPSMIDPVAAKVVNLYPLPNGTGSFNNFTATELSTNPAWQYNLKVDQNFSEKSRLSFRFSHGYSFYNIANNVYGSIADPDYGPTTVRINNAALEETYTFNPTTILAARFTAMRVYNVRTGVKFDPTTLGWPSYLLAGGLETLPTVLPAGYSNIYNNLCVDTIANQTEPYYAASLTKVKGAHNLKIGGEQRIFFNNFTEPCNPAGYFSMSNDTTSQSVFAPTAGAFGNSIASMLLGWVDNTSLSIQPGPATKSKETAFYVQDDWRLSSRLTVNAGLRYEWSSPYTERYNHEEFANFHEDSGISVPGLGEIYGVSDFATPSHRTDSPDRNNFAPRLGLAYRLTQKTVLRAGAGVYYNNSPATNDWLMGPAFRGSTSVNGSLDGGITQYGSFDNPFPAGVVYPQGTAYGKLNMWGLSNGTQMGYNFRNGEIYQWNGGVQRELKGNLLLEVDYTGSRSRHLPLVYYANKNFVSPADRVQYGSLNLAAQVPNPFYSLFQGPNAKFNVPASIYNLPTTSQVNLLRPYPQFPGSFTDWYDSGDPEGNAQYDALQVRLEKRYSNGLYFLASYTYSRMLNDGPGSNSWLGDTSTSSGWGVQDPANVRGEWSVSAGDAPNRLVWSGGYELPVGRGKRIGNSMNRWANGVVGGWQINGILSFQSGQPLNFGLANPHLADGNQRPDVTGNPRSSYTIKDVVDGRGLIVNPSAYSSPPDQIPGNAPRYDGRVRGNGINNLDASIFKDFKIREGMKLQFRGEFINFTNTPRFDNPNTVVGSPTFGTIYGQYNQPRRIQMAVRFTF